MNEDMMDMLEKMNINVDFETIIKIKGIMDKLNHRGNDPRLALLKSLRPFLKDNTQTKLDQYIEISKIIDILPIITGELNNNAK